MSFKEIKMNQQKQRDKKYQQERSKTWTSIKVRRETIKRLKQAEIYFGKYLYDDVINLMIDNLEEN